MPEPAPHPHPFGEFGRELFAVLPPFCAVSLWRAGAGPRGMGLNLAAAVAIALLAAALIAATASVAQWIALGIGIYAAFSWAQGLRLRDAPTFALIFRTPALLFSAGGFACIAFVTYALAFWGPPFFIRVHKVSASEVGIWVGLASALGGWLGVTLGGVVSDALRRRTERARLWMGVVTIGLAVPTGLFLLHAPNVELAYLANFAFTVVSPLWVGPAATTVNELVLPRMRAIASAFYLLVVTFVGLALGPYTVGKLSDFLVSAGADSGESLRRAMAYGLLPFALSGLCFLLAWSRVGRAEATKLERARAAGEA
jgi:hypothetical protein